MKKRILTVCGSGVATSVACASKIKQFCTKEGIDVDVQAISFGQLESELKNVDCIVSVNPNLKMETEVPVVSGVPLLTTIGQESTLKHIIDILKGEI